MVIDDCGFMGAVRFPAEADAPLVIDVDGMLSLAVALEGFQPVSRRDGKVVQFGDGMELGEFAQGNALDGRWISPRFPLLEKSFGFPAGEGSDHADR